MRHENSKEEEENISIGNIQEEGNMHSPLQDIEENNNISDSNTKSKADTEPLYVMTLELARGKNEQIKIYSNSNPTELAFNFCKANSLDLSALTYLKEEIDKLMLKKSISPEEEDTSNQYDQSNALSKESYPSSNQTSKLLHVNMDKRLEGGDISSINKNIFQISKEDSSISESLINNIINSSSKNMKKAPDIIQENRNSFSFNTTNQRKSASTYSRISHTRKEQQREPKDNCRHHPPRMKKHLLAPSNPFINISQSSIYKDKTNKSKSRQKEMPPQAIFKPYNPLSIASNNKYISKHIEEMKTEAKKMFTFRPQINKNNQSQSQLTFLQRQEQHSSLVKRKTHNLSNLIYSNDEDPLFRPKLISKQRRDDNIQHHYNVFNKNFDYAIRYRDNKQNYSNQYYNDLTKPANPIPESKKIVSQLYIDAFKKIFRKMDKDNDGVITSLNYSLKQLSREITKIIQPIINEMKSSNHHLNEKEFIFIMDYLCSNYELSLEDKKLILDFNKKPRRPSSVEHSTKHFDIQINDKSRKLAVKHQKKMLRSLSAKNILSERPSRQITKEKYFINQSTATTERKMSNIRHYTFDHFKQSVPL